MNIDWTKLLKSELTDGGSLFAPNELAYLALTSKIEHPFRDRLAFRLHERLASHPGLMVSREWKRVDLAVLRDSRPEMLLELKAMYSFDLHGGRAANRFSCAMRADSEKIRNISASSEMSLFTLLLVTHPHSLPPASLNPVVKYVNGIRLRTPSRIDSLDSSVRNCFKQQVAATGALTGGAAFGVPISLHYWLFGPYGVQPNSSFKPMPLRGAA